MSGNIHTRLMLALREMHESALVLNPDGGGWVDAEEWLASVGDRRSAVEASIYLDEHGLIESHVQRDWVRPANNAAAVQPLLQRQPRVMSEVAVFDPRKPRLRVVPQTDLEKAADCAYVEGFRQELLKRGIYATSSQLRDFLVARSSRGQAAEAS